MEARKHCVVAAMAFALMTGSALAQNWPNVRVDRETLACGNAVIAAGPALHGTRQPLYVAFDCATKIYFQRSTDGGQTWLPEDILVRQANALARNPDMTTDPSGNIHIIFVEFDTSGAGHAFCVHSSDMGNTWSQPVQVDDNSSALAIGEPHLAADSSGYLFAVWKDNRTGFARVWSSLSTDDGASWRTNVRIDSDTISRDDGSLDLCVQPGSNAYLVIWNSPYWDYVKLYNLLFSKSVDRGGTFSPEVAIGGGEIGLSGKLAANSGWIACCWRYSDELTYNYVRCRASADCGDTWGPPVYLLSGRNACGSSTVAVCPNGEIHCVISHWDTLAETGRVEHTLSVDHGITWVPRDAVSDTSWNLYDAYPDVVADSAGRPCCVWQNGHIWFAAGLPTAIRENDVYRPRQAAVDVYPNPCRGVLYLSKASSSKPQASSCLLDIAGRKVMTLHPGANDVSRLASGVYFVWSATTPSLPAMSETLHSTYKIIIAR
jgi:hypothetical protein